MYRRIGLFVLLLITIPVIFGAKTCSELWGDCSSRTLNDAFSHCNGVEVGGDEHINEVYIAKEIIEPNKNQTVTCTFVPTKYWSIDKIYIYYFDGTTWIKLLEDIAEYRYAYNKSISFNVGDIDGEKIVRCIISRDVVGGNCAKTGSYYDNDDLKFIVSKPLACNITCSDKKFYTREENVNCNFNCNKNIKLFYNFGDYNNYTITSGNKGSFNINFSNLNEGGNYTLNIFAEHSVTEKLYSKEFTLKSRAIISSISVPEVVKEKADIYCEVKDYYSNKKLDSYKVSFFVGNKFVGSNLTKNGMAQLTYISKSVGDKNISCSVEDSEFYFTNDTKTSSVYFSEYDIGISAKELKEMEKKLKELRQHYYEINSDSTISDKFKIELNLIKDKLDELEIYYKRGDINNFSGSYEIIKNRIDNLNWEIKVHKLREATLNNQFFYVIILLIVLIPVSYKIYSKMKKKRRELEYYKNREKELIQKRKEIEKDYFARKITQSYFNRLLLENYDQLAKTRAKIKELSK
jgi:hypothetical protein